MKSLIVNQINWFSSKADCFPWYEISFRAGVCRMSPDELVSGVCFRITTSSLHLPSGMDHVMSTIQWSGGNAAVVKAPIPCASCIYRFAPFTSENALAACELRGKTIKEQPMCHGVEYAGSNAAIRSQGPPSNIVLFYNCRPSSSSPLQSWRCQKATAPLVPP